MVAKNGDRQVVAKGATPGPDKLLSHAI
jgi:hypothetical protein